MTAASQATGTHPSSVTAQAVLPLSVGSCPMRARSSPNWARRCCAGALSPAAVYEQDPQRMGVLAKKIPTEVHGVLRLFDGQRTVADVIEDCPFRVFETLRVAQRAAEVGLVRRVRTARPRSASRAVLAVEEWLVGAEVKEPSAPMQVTETGGHTDDRGSHAAYGHRTQTICGAIVSQLAVKIITPTFQSSRSRDRAAMRFSQRYF